MSGYPSDEAGDPSKVVAHVSQRCYLGRKLYGQDVTEVYPAGGYPQHVWPLRT
jgi:hypothetical protein